MIKRLSKERELICPQFVLHTNKAVVMDSYANRPTKFVDLFVVWDMQLLVGHGPSSFVHSSSPLSLDSV